MTRTALVQLAKEQNMQQKVTITHTDVKECFVIHMNKTPKRFKLFKHPWCLSRISNRRAAYTNT